jgi:hypothetical protein
MAASAIWDIFFEFFYLLHEPKASAINEKREKDAILHEFLYDNKFITWTGRIFRRKGN